jgi:hypothetical protein
MPIEDSVLLHPEILAKPICSPLYNIANRNNPNINFLVSHFKLHHAAFAKPDSSISP